MMALEHFHSKPGLFRFEMPFDGIPRAFRVFVPAALPHNIRVPLVVTLHGGDHARSHERTSWHLLAQEKGFLVLYPEALRDGVMWNAWDNLGPSEGRQDDAAFLDSLLCRVVELLPVDPARIYLHGQSMGDMMGMHFAFLHPDRIAAAFLCSGPTKTKWWMTTDGTPRFAPHGPCPVMRLHGEEDCFRASGISPLEAKLYKQQCHVEPNAGYWIKANRCTALPYITTNEQYNVLFHAGESDCDFTSLFVKDGVHRPPAETERFAWETFFTGWRLEKGRHVRTEPERRMNADRCALAAAAGTAALLFDGEPVLTEGAKPAVSLEGMLYIDARAFNALSPQLGPVSMDDALHIQETDMVPFCRTLLRTGLCAAERFDAAYAAPHAMRLSFDLAYTIRSILGVQAPLSARDAYLLEDRIYRRQVLDAGFDAPRTREEEIWQWGHTV